MSNQFIYKGVTVTASFKSKSGTCRMCSTIQGWTFYGPQGTETAMTKASAKSRIDRYFVIAEETGEASEGWQRMRAACKRFVENASCALTAN